jgi:phosphoglycerate dehydrogenase-like enzyme
MKIAILLNMNDDLVKKLQGMLPEHQVTKLNPKDEKIEEKISEVEVIIGANVEDHILEAAKNLKLFQVPWVGVDRVNFEKLKEKKTPICNSKWNNRIVAEYAITLLLCLMKKIVPVHNSFSKGSWETRSLPSRQLTGSKILLIGFGSIGKELVKLLLPFTKNIIALRNNPDKSTPEDFKLVANIIGWDQYDAVIQNIEVLINTLPLTPATENILDEQRLNAINKKAFFINVGRGKTVNEKALYEVLKNKKIAGAGLDVWYKYKRLKDSEPFYPSEYPFHQLENVIMSPHRSATFNDTPETVWDDTIYNIKALETGKKLKNRVDVNLRY